MHYKLLFSLFAYVPTIALAGSHDVNGLWLAKSRYGDRDADVEIIDCGDGTPCGTIVWTDDNTSDAELDTQNPDSTLRIHPILGLQIVWGYSKGDRGWRRGRIYNPEDGKTFRSSMKLQEDGSLKVKGCLGPLCRTNYWTPASSVSNGE